MTSFSRGTGQPVNRNPNSVGPVAPPPFTSRSVGTTGNGFGIQESVGFDDLDTNNDDQVCRRIVQASGNMLELIVSRWNIASNPNTDVDLWPSKNSNNYTLFPQMSIEFEETAPTLEKVTVGAPYGTNYNTAGYVDKNFFFPGHSSPVTANPSTIRDIQFPSRRLKGFGYPLLDMVGETALVGITSPTTSGTVTLMSANRRATFGVRFIGKNFSAFRINRGPYVESGSDGGPFPGFRFFWRTWLVKEWSNDFRTEYF